MNINKYQKNANNKTIERGKIKGTSAFNIKQVEDIDEISWSNNKFESISVKRDNE